MDRSHPRTPEYRRAEAAAKLMEAAGWGLTLSYWYSRRDWSAMAFTPSPEHRGGGLVYAGCPLAAVRRAVWSVVNGGSRPFWEAWPAGLEPGVAAVFERFGLGFDKET